MRNSKINYSAFTIYIFLIADLFCLNLGISLANYFKFDSFFYPNETYLFLGLILNLTWVIILISTRLHKINREFRLIDHLNKVLTGLIINLSIVFALWFFAKPFYYSRQHLFFTYLFFTFFLVLWRSFWHYLIRYFRAKGFNYRKVIVLGHNSLSENLVSYFHRNPGIGYKFLGYFDNTLKPDSNKGIIGKYEDLFDYSLKENIEIIFCNAPRMSHLEMRKLINFTENNLIKLKLISQFSHLGNKDLTIQRFGEIPIISISEIPLDKRINQIIKRLFDVLFSSLVLIFIFSWLIPIIALLIKIDSTGPIFFKQQRTGKGNIPFYLWKFRTMVVNDLSDIKQATKDDPRITRVGAILRKTSIDELPQFFNVFLGDMSVVGPRPHRLRLNEEFSKKIDKFIQRHAVKPGITGLAQAKGFRGQTAEFSDMSGRVRLDRFYVKNWSLMLDFKIIILTIVSIIRGSENAY